MCCMYDMKIVFFFADFLFLFYFSSALNISSNAHADTYYKTHWIMLGSHWGESGEWNLNPPPLSFAKNFFFLKHIKSISKLRGHLIKESLSSTHHRLPPMMMITSKWIYHLTHSFNFLPNEFSQISLVVNSHFVCRCCPTLHFKLII